MTIEFGARTLHGKIDFLPDTPIAFDDPGAEEYFIACGWASKSDKAPLHTYEAGTIEIDPNAMHYDHGVPIALLIEHGNDPEKAKTAFGRERAKANAEAPLQPDDHVSEVEVK